MTHSHVPPYFSYVYVVFNVVFNVVFIVVLNVVLNVMLSVMLSVMLLRDLSEKMFQMYIRTELVTGKS